jgi:hypothetical protein
MGRGWTLLALVFVVVASACGARTVEPTPQMALTPFSRDLAGRIQPDLLACDLGVASACRELGYKLEAGNHLREAVAAYDHGCNLGGRARAAEAERCHQYSSGQSCHPAMCTQCSGAARNKAECRRSDPVICAERERFCRYETLEDCLEIVGAQLCGRAAYVYYAQMPALAAAKDNCPTPEWFVRAAAYADVACDRANRSAVAKRTGELESICKDREAIGERARKCSHVLEATDRRKIEEVRASMLSYLQSGGGTFTPGAPSTPSTPPAYVNPATKATWTSANLALIASLFPNRVEAPTPPARVESIFGQPTDEPDPAGGKDAGAPPPPPAPTKPTAPAPGTKPTK